MSEKLYHFGMQLVSLPNMGTAMPRFTMRIENMPRVFEVRRSFDWGWSVTLNWQGRRYQAKVASFDAAQTMVRRALEHGFFLGQEVGYL